MCGDYNEEMHRMFRALYAAPGDDDFEEYFGKELADLYRMNLAEEQDEGARNSPLSPALPDA